MQMPKALYDLILCISTSAVTVSYHKIIKVNCKQYLNHTDISQLATVVHHYDVLLTIRVNTTVCQSNAQIERIK